MFSFCPYMAMVAGTFLQRDMDSGQINDVVLGWGEKLMAASKMALQSSSCKFVTVA